jgi:hypothetical protein
MMMEIRPSFVMKITLFLSCLMGSGAAVFLGHAMTACLLGMGAGFIASEMMDQLQERLRQISENDDE